MKALGIVQAIAPIFLLVMIPLLLQGASVGQIDDCPKEDELKLRGSNVWGEGVGRVFVCRDGEWKRVCDSGAGFTKQDAIVTCRQLDYRYPEEAHSLGSEELGYGSKAVGTVPDCHGNETSLRDCPTLPSPDDCATHCARVDCNVNFSPTTIPPSLTVIVTVHAKSVRATYSGPSHTTMTKTSQPESTLPKASTAAVSMTMQADTRRPVETVTEGEDKTSDDIFLNLNKTSVMVIVGVTMVIVTTGIVASACFIVCGVKKNRHTKKKIKMKPNSAYMSQDEIEQMKNSARDSGLRTVPIYEQIE